MLSHIAHALPEVFVLSMACIALLAHLFIKQAQESVTYYIVQLALIGAAAMSVAHFGDAKVVIFHGGYIKDNLASLLKIFIYLTSFITFWYSRSYLAEREIPQGEYYLLGLFSVLGMMLLVSAHSLITLFMGLEILSLPLYAIVALQRKNAHATEAALKYFIMGALASAMLLYGLSMLYGASGSLNIDTIAKTIANTAHKDSLIVAFALVFIVVGIGFKLAAVPFHMWAPDVYQGAPSSVTVFIGTAPKVAAFGMAIRLLVDAMPAFVIQWQELLIIMAVLSMALGNILAISQSNLKRMLAYSGIAHIGYMFLGLLVGSKAGYSAALFYILIYSLMSLGGLGMIVLLSRAGIEAENIRDFQGLNQRNPWLAFLMLIVMFSMAGVPPTVGFFAKLLVLQSLVHAHLTWLAIVAVVFAIIGAYYYLRVVKTMYFDDAINDAPVPQAFGNTVVMTINGLLLLALGLFPAFLIQLCQSAF